MENKIRISQINVFGDYKMYIDFAYNNYDIIKKWLTDNNDKLEHGKEYGLKDLEDLEKKLIGLDKLNGDIVFLVYKCKDKFFTADSYCIDIDACGCA